MQQILAYETDLLEYGDLFDGSKVMDEKVEALKAEAKEELKRIEAMGGAVAAVESGYMKQQLVESEHRAARGDRARRADRGRRQQVPGNRAVAADRRRRVHPDRAGGGRDRPDRAAARPGARSATNAAVQTALAELKRARRGPGQHHAGLDRLRQSRRHHRRMGLDAARSARRIPRADRRRPRDAQRRRPASTTSAPTSTACRASSGGVSPSWSASPASTAIPTAPNRSRCARATPACRWSTRASASRRRRSSPQRRSRRRT